MFSVETSCPLTVTSTNQGKHHCSCRITPRFHHQDDSTLELDQCRVIVVETELVRYFELIDSENGGITRAIERLYNCNRSRTDFMVVFTLNSSSTSYTNTFHQQSDLFLLNINTFIYTGCKLPELLPTCMLVCLNPIS